MKTHPAIFLYCCPVSHIFKCKGSFLSHENGNGSYLLIYDLPYWIQPYPSEILLSLWVF